MLTYFQRKFFDTTPGTALVTAYLKVNDNYRDTVSTISGSTLEITTYPTIGGCTVVDDTNFMEDRIKAYPCTKEDEAKVLEAQATSDQTILQRDAHKLKILNTLNLAVELANKLSRDAKELLGDLEKVGEGSNPYNDLVECIGNGDDLEESLHAEGFNGILLEVSKPTKCEDSSAYSWNVSKVSYVYANSYDEAVKQALAWSQL